MAERPWGFDSPLSQSPFAPLCPALECTRRYNSVVKTEFADLSETKKSVAVEIPSDIVDAQIDRVARSYSRQARIPGFRQGKVPPTLIKKRFREQILHDVAHDLDPARDRRGAARARPRAGRHARREGRVARRRAGADVYRHVRDAAAHRSRAAGHDFAAAPRGDARRERGRADADAAAEPRGARYEPVEGRGVEDGDTVTLDVERTPTAAGEKAGPSSRRGRRDRRQGQPAGIRRQAEGPRGRGAARRFTIHYPDDYAVKEMAGTSVEYAVNGEGHPQARAAGARRRVREGRRRVRDAAGAARPRIGRICSARRKPKPTGISAAT